MSGQRDNSKTFFSPVQATSGLIQSYSLTHSRHPFKVINLTYTPRTFRTICNSNEVSFEVGIFTPRHGISHRRFRWGHFCRKKILVEFSLPISIWLTAENMFYGGAPPSSFTPSSIQLTFSECSKVCQTFLWFCNFYSLINYLVWPLRNDNSSKAPARHHSVRRRNKKDSRCVFFIFG